MSPWTEAGIRLAMQTSIAFVAVWLLTRAFRSLSPNARAWLWRLAALKSLWSITFMIPVAILAPEPQFNAMPPSMPLVVAPETNAVIATLPERAPSPANLDPWACLWVLGIAVAGGRLALGAYACRRRARGIPDAEAAELSHEMGLKRSPFVWASPDFTTPMLTGVLRPMILLPNSMKGQERRMALAHEIAHAKRRDCLWSLVLNVVGALFWFLPPVHWATREAEMASEEACDQLALRVTGAPADAYADLLLTYARSGASRLTLALSSRKTLERRIKSMFSNQSTSLRFSWIPCAVVAFAALLPWSAVAQQSEDRTYDTPFGNFGWGYANAILSSPTVQKEVHLSKEQVAKIGHVRESFWTKFQRFSNELARQKADNVSDADRNKFDERERSGLYRDMNASLLSVLTAEQSSRIRQLVWQITGERALGSPSVAKEIGIRESRQKKIHELVVNQQKRYSDEWKKFNEHWQEPIGHDLSRLTPAERKEWSHVQERMHLASGKERVQIYASWRSLMTKTAVYSEAARHHTLTGLQPTLEKANRQFLAKRKFDAAATNRKINAMLTDEERRRWRRALGAPLDYPEKRNF